MLGFGELLEVCDGLAACGRYGPVLVSPDLLGLGDESLYLSQAFEEYDKAASANGEPSYTKMTVVQYRPTDGVMTWCVRQNRVTTPWIGIPKRTPDRLELLRYLDKTRMYRKDVKYHLLGCNNLEELREAAKLPWITSCDSKKFAKDIAMWDEAAKL